MQITMDQRIVKTLVSGFNKIISRSANAGVGQNVLIQSGQDSTVTVTGIGLEQTLVFTFESADENATNAPFLFPYSEFKNWAAVLKKNDTVTLVSQADGVVTITEQIDGEDTTRGMNVDPVESFPNQLKSVTVQSFDVSGFLTLYKNALPFSATNDNRQALNGVFCHSAPSVMVATDGKRLARFPLAEYPFGECDAILPETKLLKSDLLADEGEAHIGIDVDGGTGVVEFRSGPWIYQVACVDSLYPNYAQVLPPVDMDYSGSCSFNGDGLEDVSAALREVTDREHGFVYLYGDSDAAIAINEDLNKHVTLPTSSAEFENPTLFSMNVSSFEQALQAGFLSVDLPAVHSPVRFTNESGGIHILMPAEIGNEADLIETVQQLINCAANEDAGTDTPAASSESGLTLVEVATPLETLVQTLDSAQDALRTANAAFKGIKGKIRALEKHYREKDREYEKANKVLAQLQEVVNF